MFTQNGSCARSDNDLDNGIGGGERHLLDKYGHVKALVFGHFGEFNDGLLKLADDISFQECGQAAPPHLLALGIAMSHRCL